MGENSSTCSSTKVLSVDLQERRTDKRPRDIYEELCNFWGLLMGVQGPQDSSKDGK